jgi:hypothetical protein
MFAPSVASQLRAAAARKRAERDAALEAFTPPEAVPPERAAATRPKGRTCGHGREVQPTSRFERGRESRLDISTIDRLLSHDAELSSPPSAFKDYRGLTATVAGTRHLTVCQCRGECLCPLARPIHFKHQEVRSDSCVRSFQLKGVGMRCPRRFGDPARPPELRLIYRLFHSWKTLRALLCGSGSVQGSSLLIATSFPAAHAQRTT